MKLILFIASVSLLSTLSHSDEPNPLEAFRQEISKDSLLRKHLTRDFKSWDENEDGRLDAEDGAIGTEGLFLSQEIFDRVDESKSKSVSLIEYLNYQYAEVYYALDMKRDGSLSTQEKARIESNPIDFLRWMDKGKLEFTIEGDTAYCNGTIKSKVAKQFQTLFAEHPEVKKLVFGWMPGSNDDERMLEAMDIILKHGVDTHAADHARIYSGGVDLFTVGKKRTIGKDVEFGVHTWASGKRREGGKLSKNHKTHRPYVKYYEKVETPVDFYWFTLEAATADGMHLMTKDELIKYKIVSP